MAGRPKKVAEVSEDTKEVEIVETIEQTPEELEVFVEEVAETKFEQSKEVVSVEFSKEIPSEPLIEVVEYQPKDIVEFYNLRGELRYAPYAYITKRGYKALRKYTKKK